MLLIPAGFCQEEPIPVRNLKNKMQTFAAKGLYFLSKLTGKLSAWQISPGQAIINIAFF